MCFWLTYWRVDVKFPICVAVSNPVYLSECMIVNEVNSGELAAGLRLGDDISSEFFSERIHVFEV